MLSTYLLPYKCQGVITMNVFASLNWQKKPNNNTTPSNLIIHLESLFAISNVWPTVDILSLFHFLPFFLRWDLIGYQRICFSTLSTWRHQFFRVHGYYVCICLANIIHVKKPITSSQLIGRFYSIILCK